MEESDAANISEANTEWRWGGDDHITYDNPTK